jgi:uncharacterized protein YbjT (DUF2867 family)
MRILVTGISGYVGAALAPVLTAEGHFVRGFARSAERVVAAGARVEELVIGDALTGAGLDQALDGIDVAYYLIHSMGRGNPADFAARDREAAANFVRAARDAGVGRVIYLGGLEGESEHLHSREEVATILREHVPATIHARAAMVIGEGSASFVMLRSLVERLPAMITPRWIETRTQPIAVGDVLAALVALADVEPVPDEVELGGADVLTYKEMMDRTAALLGRRKRPVVTVPVLTPRLSSYWVGFVTPVEAGLARPLVEGLSAEMIVRTPPPPGINDRPMGFDDAVKAALA